MTYTSHGASARQHAPLPVPSLLHSNAFLRPLFLNLRTVLLSGTWHHILWYNFTEVSGIILPSSSGTKSTRCKQAKWWLLLTWLPTFRGNLLPSYSGLRSKTIKQHSSLVMLAACMFPDVSEERTASIYRVEEQAEHACSKQSDACCLIGLLFEPEDGSSIFCCSP
jgi:hypothetical protein